MTDQAMSKSDMERAFDIPELKQFKKPNKDRNKMRLFEGDIVLVPLKVVGKGWASFEVETVDGQFGFASADEIVGIARASSLKSQTQHSKEGEGK